MTAIAPALRRAAALLATVAVLAASSQAEAAKRKKKRARKKPAPIAEVARPLDPFAVSFPSSDGVRLVATWRPAPGGASAPAVLLLHAFSRERRDVAGLAEELSSRGFATLALDLRGHGESVRKGGVRINLSPSLQGSPKGFPLDVAAACAWLRSRASRVGVVGFSLSGNLAALATSSGWADAGVAVSTNTDRLAQLAGGRSTSPRGLLVLASEKDPGRATSARALDASGRDPKSVVLYPGAAHALDLLRSEPAAKTALLDWLEARLGPIAPPPPSPVATIAPPAPVAAPIPAPTPAPGRDGP